MIELSGRALSRAWPAVSLAASDDDGLPVLYRAVHVEEFENGVRLVATDSYWLAHAWVPHIDEVDRPAPLLEEVPERTVTVSDVEFRVRALVAHVGKQTRRQDDPDVRVLFDPATSMYDEDRPTLSPELALQRCTVEIPGAERVLAPTLQGIEFPNWRQLLAENFGDDPVPVPQVSVGGWMLGALSKASKLAGSGVVQIDWLDQRRARWRCVDPEKTGHLPQGVFMAVAHREPVVPDGDPGLPLDNDPYSETASADGIVEAAATALAGSLAADESVTIASGGKVVKVAGRTRKSKTVDTVKPGAK